MRNIVGLKDNAYVGEGRIGMPRKPSGFIRVAVPVGVLFLRTVGIAHWVILAADPEIKIDNAHDDRIPHMHLNGWNSEDRRDLRPTLSPDEAVRMIRIHLETQGYIDTDQLLEDLR